MELADRAEKDKKIMFDCLDSVDIENIQSTGLTIRIGEKILKMALTDEYPIDDIGQVKKEIKDKINQKQERIKEKINEKIKEITEYHHQMKLEYKRKERELKDILKRSSPMPDIFEKHATKGLSVVKGQNKDEMIWLVQGVYWPKTYENDNIEAKFSKKMISPVIFMIKTTGSRVTQVSTRKPIGLDYFSHYHQSRPDCWGNWSSPDSFKNPDDIINIARQAEAVLENINPGSIAEANPRGLPRQNTIKRHLIPKIKKEETKANPLNQSTRRTGITEGLRMDDQDIWSSM